MSIYCKTINEKDGRRMYGIDLVEYADGQFTVLMSKQDITSNWKLINRIVRYANAIKVPENLFDEFLGTMLKKK